MSSKPIINVISDDETTPFSNKKKQKTSSSFDFDSNPETVLIIDDDPTPHKSFSSWSCFSGKSVVPETPSCSVVPETPFPESSYVPVVRRCNQLQSFSLSPNPNTSGTGLICLESDDDEENEGLLERRNEPTKLFDIQAENSAEVRSNCLEEASLSPLEDRSCFPPIAEYDLPQISDHFEEDDDILPLTSKTVTMKDNQKRKDISVEKRSVAEEKAYLEVQPSICLEEDSLLEDSSRFPPIVDDDLPQISDHSGEEDDILPLTSKNVKTKDNKKRKEIAVKKRSSAEEKARLMNERKQQKEKEKIEKAALKAQAAEAKKMQKEIERWEKGKFAQQSIVAKIDTKVVEQGSIGGQLLTRLAEKGITFQITSNPVERSIIWTMSVPQDIAQAMSRGTDIPYVVLVYEAKEFCDIVADESIMDHVARVQSIYPSYTLSILTNRLLAYITKREQENYKNPGSDNWWRRPPVEKALSKLTTHFVGIHSRLCTDESELAEHVVGLTCSLASCQFRKKLTRLSVNANGSLISKDATDRALIKKSTWLKALVAMPKVQPRFAVAIWRKYPTYKSLLRVYMDPSKSEREKEFLLVNLITEGSVGDIKRLGEVCSKRVYRILVAERGTTKTDDVENGADFFSRQASL